MMIQYIVFDQCFFCRGILERDFWHTFAFLCVLFNFKYWFPVILKVYNGDVLRKKYNKIEESGHFDHDLLSY